MKCCSKVQWQVGITILNSVVLWWPHLCQFEVLSVSLNITKKIYCMSYYQCRVTVVEMFLNHGGLKNNNYFSVSLDLETFSQI